VQKLLLTLLTTVLFEQPLILAALITSIHGFYFLFNVVVQPYKNPSVSGFTIGMGLCLTGTSVLALVLALDFDVSIYYVLAILVVDLVVPIVLAVLFDRLSRNRVAPSDDQQMINNNGEGNEDRNGNGKGKGKKSKSARAKEAELKSRAASADYVINDFTLTTMSNYFILVGILAFMALAAATVGILFSNTNSAVVTNHGNMQAYEFAGYSSWSDFTSHCCCIQQPNSDETQETWKCVNGDFKLRTRIDAAADGREVRKYCSPLFNANVCEVPSSNTDFLPVLCSNATSLRLNVLSLW